MQINFDRLKQVGGAVVLTMIAFVAVHAYKLDVGEAPKTSDTEFQFAVMDVFTISSADFDVVATGLVKSGRITPNRSACVIGADGTRLDVEIVSMSIRGKQVDVAETGDRLGLGISGASKEQIAAGDLIASGC